MRNDGVVSVVALGLVCLDIAGNRVGQAMAQVDSGIAKPYAGKCTGQVHGRPGLLVISIVDRAGEIFSDCMQGLSGPDVRDGIAALIGWSVLRGCGSWRPLIVFNCCEGLQSMTENIKPRVSSHSLRHVQCVQWIYDTEKRSEALQ